MKAKSLFLLAALLLSAICSCTIIDDPIRTEEPDNIIIPRQFQYAPEETRTAPSATLDNQAPADSCAILSSIYNNF